MTDDSKAEDPARFRLLARSEDGQVCGDLARALAKILLLDCEARGFKASIALSIEYPDEQGGLVSAEYVDSCCSGHALYAAARLTRAVVNGMPDDPSPAPMVTH